MTRKEGQISPHNPRMANVEDPPWWKYKNYMESCYTPPWLTLMDDHTSPAWKPCLEFSMTILTFHGPHPDKSLLTLTGGPLNSPNQPSEEVSQQHTRFTTSLLSWMQAQARVSQLSLEQDGGCGDSSQDGTRTAGTSGGLRQWASNSLYEPLHVSAQLIGKNTLRSTKTTKGLLRAGKGAAAETLALTRFSNV